MPQQQVKHTATIRLNETPDVVFPLFTPLGETKWIAGWNPELIYPASGEAMTGNVFATQHEGQAKTIWVTVDYDTQAYHAEYINMTPDSHVSRIEVRCRAANGGQTEAEVSYTLTAIAEAGYSELAKASDEAFHKRMGHWQAALNHYLKHGEAIPHH